MDDKKKAWADYLVALTRYTADLTAWIFRQQSSPVASLDENPDPPRPPKPPEP